VLIDELLRWKLSVDFHLAVLQLKKIAVSQLASHHPLHGFGHQKGEDVLEALAPRDLFVELVYLGEDPLAGVLRISIADKEVEKLLFVGLKAHLSEKLRPLGVQHRQKLMMG